MHRNRHIYTCGSNLHRCPTPPHTHTDTPPRHDAGCVGTLSGQIFTNLDPVLVNDDGGSFETKMEFPVIKKWACNCHMPE